MTLIYEELKPALVWKHFEQILKIPHCSGSETALGNYVISQAKKFDLNWKRDDVGNVVVSKKASSGNENAPGVILQGHIDMVCEKILTWSMILARTPSRPKKKEIGSQQREQPLVQIMESEWRPPWH